MFVAHVHEYLPCELSEVGRRANHEVVDSLERVAALAVRDRVDSLEKIGAVGLLAVLEDLVHQTHACEVGVDRVEQERVQYLAEQEGQARIVLDALLRERGFVRLPGLLAQCDHEHAIGAEPQRGRERGVEAQPAVGEVAAADADRRKQHRNRRGRERVMGREPRRAREDGRVTGPA